MENELHLQLDNNLHNHNRNDGISPPTLSDFFLRSSFPQLSTQNHEKMIEFPPLISSSSHGDPFNDHLQAEIFSSNFSYSSSSVVQNSVNCGYDGLLSANQWMISNCGNNIPNNELSLSLASSQGFIPNNCSKNPPFSHEMVSSSTYLTALKQILTQVSSFSLEGVNRDSYSSVFAGSIPSYNGSFEAQAESSSRRQEVEAKKSQLLYLLELVDDCYNRCLDEIHTVISAFHAATELDPQLHSCFTLRTVSFFYKNLRERISNEIIFISNNNNVGFFEKSFIQKQWTIQQLKRKDQQLWRPQRGLPERSVSILRAWMFENFLHPYPKDYEKHLLALKSGLTRSQVSNWFINARVRIWKPLVEDMCSELSRRRGVSTRQNNEGTSDNRNDNHMTGQLSIYEHTRRFNT